MYDFSVLTPVYRTAPYLRQAVESVLAQTNPRWELMLLDDGDPDASLERVADLTGDPRIRVIRREYNAGASAARNNALRSARAPWIVQLDGDDWLLPEYMARLADAVAERPDAAIATPDFRVWLDGPGIWRDRSHFETIGFDPDDRRSLIERLLHENFVAVPCALRREALVAVGGWSARLEGINDRELYLRLARAGYTAVTVEEPLAAYRVRGDSTARDDQGRLRDETRIWRQQLYAHVLESYELTSSERAMARRMYRQAEGELAVERARRSGSADERRAARRGARRALRGRQSPRSTLALALIALSPRLFRRVDDRRGASRGGSASDERAREGADSLSG